MNTSTYIPPNEYAGVLLLARKFAPFHAQGRNKTFLNSQPGNDLAIAELAAKTFAESNHIPYVPILMKPARPIIALVRRDNLWYPAHVLSDNLQVMSTFAGQPIGTPSEEIAERIATIVARLNSNLELQLSIRFDISPTPLAL